MRRIFEVTNVRNSEYNALESTSRAQTKCSCVSSGFIGYVHRPRSPQGIWKIRAVHEY